MNTQIDYSAISPSVGQKIDEDWEPPRHVFFGKKIENGKTEKEPIYTHKAYPKIVYGQVDGKVVAKQVNSDTEQVQLGEGWEESPEAFGIITSPSFEQTQELAAKPKTLSVKK